MTKYLNSYPGSLIKAVTVSDRKVIFHKTDPDEEVFFEPNIANVLNYTTGRIKDDQNFKIDKSIEYIIYHEFMDVVWLRNDLYIYTGSDQSNIASTKDQHAKRKTLVDNYLLAPKKIELINNNCAKDENGKLWGIGISPMKIQLSAKKINSSHDQLRLNKELCKSAKLVNNSPNFKYPRPEDGADAITGRLSSHFTRIDRFCFKLDKNISPSKAIRSLFSPLPRPFIIECAMAIQLMEYKAVLEFVGDQVFDNIFSKLGVVLSRSSEGNPILPCRNQINNQWRDLAENQEKFLAEIIPGDILYIRNIETYLLRHAFGESNGHNVVYLGKNSKGEQEFAGLFTIKRVRTYKEILDLLVDDYNEIPHYIIEGENGIECTKPKLGGIC